MLKDYQREFIDYAIELEVLRFGQFTLKSGRSSPYFFNAGLFNTGEALAKLGRFYAAAIQDQGDDFDLLFGPAYKGIPIAASTAVALADHFGNNIGWCFNRKEAKDHGEGGNLVGAPLAGRVLIIDDVITAGTAIREVMQMLSGIPSAQVAGVVVALDRQERGQGGLSAIQEVAREFEIPVYSIINLQQLIAYLEESVHHSGQQPQEFTQHLAQIRAYRAQYGV